MIDPQEIPLSRVDWDSCHRLIPSRYPTVGLFDAIADPADLDVVFAIEMMTNPRMRNELGQIELVPAEERISGPGTTPIMSAFTHLNPEGSRFSDGNYGVYYASESLDTAIAEVSFHRARFLSYTNEPAIDIDLRLIVAKIVAKLHDLRGDVDKAAEIYDPDHYAAGQALGRALRANGSSGVVYRSVRRPAGECIGIFRPRALADARATQHLGMHWDGERITHWYVKEEPRSLAP